MDGSSEKVPAEQIFQILRDRICLLEYPPGHRLRESVLAEEFGVSRTPIRAVLQQLAHGGLIESKDGVGTIVTTLSLDEIVDIYRMRIQIAELIGKMSPNPVVQEHVDSAAALRRRAESLLTAFELDEYWRINHDLHFLIAELIGNNALRQTWHHLYFQAARMWYRFAMIDSEHVTAMLAAELQEVNLALEERDVLALGYVQRNFIAYGLRKLEGGAEQNS